MGDVADGRGRLFGDGEPQDSVTGVAGPVLLAATVPDLSRGDVLAGRYQIEAAIGTGGSGRVLRAFDRVTRSPVALKILRSEFAADPVWTERFSRELRVGRQIQHPNVCRVYDIGEADGHRFLSMELATGGTLRSQMEPGAAARSVDDRIADARAIIQGVAALHAAGIVHRDLKPENILRAEDGRLLVSDFGLATDPGSGPATTIMIGTPRYMAPEVVMGDPATARSDIWALGVVMHEILSGERPDRSLIKRRRRIYTPPEVGSLRERRLVELCARCSEEDPEDRPASAVELRREFEAAAAGRRFGNRAVKKQIAWAAVAVAAVASLGLIRNRWTSRAVASSSQGALSAGSPVPQFVGRAADWSSGAQLAAFSGRFHCISVLPGTNKVRVVWGSPRRAEDVDSLTGLRALSALAPETYVDGCPVLSGNGRRLLFSKTDSSGSHVFLSETPDGRNAKAVVRGFAPQWLPNDQEFVFSIDSRHAAIFAVSSGEMTVVTDGDTGVRQLGEYDINRTGSRLAIRYAIGASESIVVVHALPSLDVVGRIRVPAFAQRLHFGKEEDSLFFSLEGADGFSLLHSIALPSGTITRVGGVLRANVITSLERGASRLVVSQKRRNDLWLDQGSNLVPLTSDGNSVHGELSRTGDLVIQRRLQDGRLAVVLRHHGGGEEQITNGPTDVTPSFVPDGSAVLLAKLNDEAIAECNLRDKQCRVVHTDPLTPGFPASSPSGKQVAYLTLMGAPRIRLISRMGGQQRDLGPAGGDACAPYWRSEERLWVAGRTKGSNLSWEEFDAVSGQRTGAVESATILEGQECDLPTALISRGPDAVSGRVLAIARDSVQLSRTIAESLPN